MAARVLVLTGGGIKGAVTAALCRDHQQFVLLHVDYGQPSAASERAAVETLTKTLPEARALILQHPQSRWLDEQVDRWGRSRQKPGRADRTSNPTGGPTTRGLLPSLLATGLRCALRINASCIAVGISRWVDASHLGLPALDGRPSHAREFMYGFEIMFDSLLGGRSSLGLQTPLMEMTYADIHKLAVRFGVALDKTWSCTLGGRKPCGRCDACRTRAAAAADSAVPAAV